MGGEPMKISSLKTPAVAALVLGAVTSADAAMPVQRANGDSSIVLVGCAYGWYRGPDGQCYVGGTGPGYYGGGYYYGYPGYYYGGDYYGNRGWHRGWYQGRHRGYYKHYGRPYEN